MRSVRTQVKLIPFGYLRTFIADACGRGPILDKVRHGLWGGDLMRSLGWLRSLVMNEMRGQIKRPR